MHKEYKTLTKSTNFSWWKKKKKKGRFNTRGTKTHETIVKSL